jgi:hypothetical protein
LKTREFKPTDELEFLESKNCDPLALIRHSGYGSSS